jgi:hypothetical protein
MSWKNILKNDFISHGKRKDFKSKVAFPNTSYSGLRSYIVDDKEVLAQVYSSKEDVLSSDIRTSNLRDFLEQNGGFSIQQLEPAATKEDGTVFDWYIVLERKD